MAQLPTDVTLTEDGLAPEGQGRVLILACGALAREIKALIAKHGWDQLDLMCLPAILHNRPERIVPAMQTAVARHRARYERIFLAYADCGTGGQLAAAAEELGLEMIAGPHCYAFFEGNDAFAKHDEFDAFYLTDFLVRQFDTFVIKNLGLDRYPQLRDDYFQHYRVLVYQAQTEDEELTIKARAAAERLGLAFERRFTGYGELALELKRVAEAR